MVVLCSPRFGYVAAPYIQDILTPFDFLFISEVHMGRRQNHNRLLFLFHLNAALCSFLICCMRTVNVTGATRHFP
jgi:hypothetical protein